VRTLPIISDRITGVESQAALDGMAQRVDAVAKRLRQGRLGEVLRGDWLGHALHPLLTDFPLGCWLSAGLLDLGGGRSMRNAASRLVGIGVLAAVPTALAGAADYAEITNTPVRRVGVLHAVGNGAVLLAYALSWRERRRGRHEVGVLLGLAGGTLAWLTGYLGGHLSLARRVGTGERGLQLAPVDQEPASR